MHKIKLPGGYTAHVSDAQFRHMCEAELRQLVKVNQEGTDEDLITAFVAAVKRLNLFCEDSHCEAK